ncbi:MAG: HD domain-containing protein [Synergistaceae bacterium]|jgi:3'-5' exoribonuclease|nr:HD domain-containing protein [Synergistaceae bacterium]
MSTVEVKKLPKDSTFYVLGVISRIVQRRDKNDRPFWDLTLMDEYGQIEGKAWGNADWWDIRGDVKYKTDPLEDENFKNLEGQTAGLQGKVVEFRDQNQFNFNAVYYVDQEKYPPYSFVRRSPMPPEKMEKEFRDLIGTCGQPMRGFLEDLFFNRGIWREYSTCPAAVNMHHAYVGGLLEHSLTTTRSAVGIAQSYRDAGFAVNMDVVIGGGLLHDLGKLETYRLSPAPEVTLAGNVVDHIVMGYHRFMNLAADCGLDEMTALAVGHILVSHHGSKEFGSPVLPATPEALIVSAADELDFRLYCWREQTGQLEGAKEVTEYILPVQRRFWKSPRGGEPEAESSTSA